MKLSEIKKILPENQCDCEECKAMCERRPCWPTPKEAMLIIKAGFADRLMLDYWVSSPDDIEILCPAKAGSECQRSPFNPEGPCVLQNKNGLCPLHSLGIKPLEGRLAYHGDKGEEAGKASDMLHKAIAMEWNSKKGKATVAYWKKRVKTIAKAAILWIT